MISRAPTTAASTRRRRSKLAATSSAWAEAGPIAGDGDADARPEIGGFDEERVRQGGRDLVEHRLALLLPAGAGEPAVVDDGQVLGAEGGLHDDLVHADGRADDAGPCIGNVGHLEEALEGAVLAEGAMDAGQQTVELDGADFGGRAGRAPGRRGAGHRLGAEEDRLAAGDQGGRVLEGLDRRSSGPVYQRPSLAMKIGTTS